MGSRFITFSAGLIASAGLWAGAAFAACSPDRVNLRGDWGSAGFSVEIADSRAERNRGLMFRRSMAASAGMLFIYPNPRRASFWMKNTLIPLDMIFADQHGVVQTVHANAIPRDLTNIFGGNNIQYVLEINGGLAAQIGIVPGSELQHPGISQESAAWPC